GRQVTGNFQVPQTNYILQTPDNGGPVLVYGPRLSGNAQAIGSYLDQRCVAACSDLDGVLTSLHVLNLANPNNPAPLAAAVNQLSPDRYGALPLVIGNQQTLILDAFGARLVTIAPADRARSGRWSGSRRRCRARGHRRLRSRARRARRRCWSGSPAWCCWCRACRTPRARAP